jgi:hypothetical protein
MYRRYQYSGEGQAIELFNQVEHQLRVRASPAMGKDPSIADIGSDDNASRESRAHIDEPIRVFECPGSDHHTLSAVVQHLINRGLTSDSSPDLNFRIGGGENCLDLRCVLPSSSDAIKVNDVKMMESILSPSTGDPNGPGCATAPCRTSRRQAGHRPLLSGRVRELRSSGVVNVEGTNHD